jgi:hypothetical protein
VAIGFRTSASGDIASTAATVTPTKPTGFASTDVLVYVFAEDNGASTTTTITAPGGFTRIGATTLGSSGVNRIKLDAFWCLGSQVSMGFTNSHTGSGFQQGWVALAFTGVDNTTAVDVADSAGTNTGTGATSLTVNGVTIATDQAWDCIACCDWNSGVVSATNFTAVENGHTNAMVAALYNTTPKSVGATGTASVADTASATSQIMAAIRFALRPAAGGSTSPVAKMYVQSQAVRRASFF